MFELILLIIALFIFMIVFVLIITGDRKVAMILLSMANVIILFFAISTLTTTNQPNDFVQFEDGLYWIKYLLVIIFISISGLVTFYWYKELEEIEVGRKNDL